MGFKTLVICGCGRHEGFTFGICSSFSEELKKAGSEVSVVYPIDMKISHCTGCGRCEKEGRCVIRDDMDAIYGKFAESDVVVLITPVHFSGPSSVIKTAIDRFQTVWYSGRKGPKYMAGIMSGGSSEPYFAGTRRTFKALAITAGSEWIGELEIPGTDSMDPEEASAEAEKFARYVASAVIRKP